MIRSCGLKGDNSSKPIVLMAILMSSLSETPTERCCFTKKYFPASINDFNGTNPTNSEPVTRIPRSVAFLQTSSKAMCKGVILIFVRFIDI